MKKLKSILTDIFIWVIGCFVLIPYIIIHPIIEIIQYLRLRVLWLIKYGVNQKKFLIVYSNEKLSKNYFIDKVIPLFKADELVINISDLKGTKAANLEVKVFRKWAGDKDHLPIVIFFPSIGKIKTFRYLQAFSIVEDFGEFTMLDDRTDELKSFIQEVYQSNRL